MIYKLSDIFDLQMGKTPTRSDLSYWQNGSYDWISISDLNTDRKYISDTKERITTKAVRESGIKKIPANTVIMSFKLSIGKTAITSHDMFSNEAIMAFIDRKVIRINPDYIYYLLHALDWNKRANKAVKGRTVNKKIISQTQVNIPDYQTQLRIVKIMDSTRKRVKIQKDILSKLDTLIKARFVEMFGDPIVNPYNFKQEKLERLSCLITKGASPTWQGFNYVEDDDQTLFITSENVKNGYLDLKKSKYVENKFNDKHRRSILQKGDFLINIVGASIGRAAQYSENKLANINQAVALVRLKLNVISSVYLSIYLNSNKALDMYQKMQSNVARANLSLQNIKDLEIILPPIELQNEFASFVQQVDKSKVVNASIMKYIISIRFYLYFKENKEGAR